MLRGRASRRLEESTLVRDNLRGLCRAINAYVDVMRRHREGLEQLHACASGTGLEVPGNRIMPPVETIKDATEKEMDAWEASWKAYRECFDRKIELRDIRRVSARELIRALGEARSEAGNLQSTVDREQAEANRAARNLQDAESGTPRIVAEQVGLDPSTNLKDRLG